MNKKVGKIGIALGILLGTTIIAYAITSLFFTKSERSNLLKKTVFQFDLSTDMAATEVGPGDSFDVKPVVLTDKEKELFEKYNSAKAVKDFQLADQYRQQLIDKNLM